MIYLFPIYSHTSLKLKCFSMPSPDASESPADWHSPRWTMAFMLLGFSGLLIPLACLLTSCWWGYNSKAVLKLKYLIINWHKAKVSIGFVYIYNIYRDMWTCGTNQTLHFLDQDPSWSIVSTCLTIAVPPAWHPEPAVIAESRKMVKAETQCQKREWVHVCARIDFFEHAPPGAWKIKRGWLRVVLNGHLRGASWCFASGIWFRVVESWVFLISYKKSSQILNSAIRTYRFDKRNPPIPRHERLREANRPRLMEAMACHTRR